MLQYRTANRLLCLHRPPVSDEWVTYTEYVARLLGSALTYRETETIDPREATASNPIDLIVLYETPPSWWRRLLKLTPAFRLAARAPASLLVARGPRWPVSRILLVLRLEPSDLAAIAWTRRLAQAAPAVVTVMPILPPIPDLFAFHPGFRPNVRRLLTADAPSAARLRHLARQFEAWEIDAALRLRSGNPERQLRNELREAEYDLVIIGAEPSDRLYRFLVGDLVGPLLHYSRIPILVARDENRTGERVSYLQALSDNETAYR